MQTHDSIIHPNHSAQLLIATSSVFRCVSESRMPAIKEDMFIAWQGFNVGYYECRACVRNNGSVHTICNEYNYNTRAIKITIYHN